MGAASSATASSLPALTLGGSVTGTLSVGEDLLYTLVIPGGTDVRVNLSLAAPGLTLKLLATACVVVLGSAFFSCLSMSIAGIALNRDRLMGIGQAITMPLFFSSNALYPTALMPGWLQAISRVNPLSYEVDALRNLLIGVPSNLALDIAVLIGSAVAAIIVASALLPRLAK